MSKELGTQENPVWMAVSGVQKPKVKDIVIVTVISLAPVAIAILMQKPALRQAIVMRFWHYSRATTQAIANTFQDCATKAAMEYNKAKL